MLAAAAATQAASVPAGARARMVAKTWAMGQATVRTLSRVWGVVVAAVPAAETAVWAAVALAAVLAAVPTPSAVAGLVAAVAVVLAAVPAGLAIAGLVATVTIVAIVAVVVAVAAVQMQ